MTWFINHNQIPHHLHINKDSKLISSSLPLHHIFLNLKLCLHLSYLQFSTPLKTLRTRCSFDPPCMKVRIFPWLFCLGPRTYCSPFHQAEKLSKPQGSLSCKHHFKKGCFCMMESWITLPKDCAALCMALEKLLVIKPCKNFTLCTNHLLTFVIHKYQIYFPSLFLWWRSCLALESVPVPAKSH